jgi:hypothetical protein
MSNRPMQPEMPAIMVMKTRRRLYAKLIANH